MEYLNTCTLGLRLTVSEQQEALRLGIDSWGEEKCRIALELRRSGSSDCLQERTNAIYMYLVARMLQRRYATLEKIDARIDQLTKGSGLGLEERRLLETNYQIITSRAIHQLESRASSDQISQSLSQIGTMLSRVSCVPKEAGRSASALRDVAEAEFFSGSFPSKMNDTMILSLIDRIRRSTGIFGRCCWEGRPDDYRILVRREEIHAEMTRIENIQDQTQDTARSLTEEEDQVLEKLVTLQEFPKELVF